MEREIKIPYKEYLELQNTNSRLTEENCKLKDAFCFTTRIGITNIYSKEEIHNRVKSDAHNNYKKYIRYKSVLNALFKNNRFKRRNRALYEALQLEKIEINTM